MTDLWRYEAIYAVVATIPAGRVATYGQVAGAAGLPGRARLVGRALKSLPEHSPVPWYRVVGSGGRIRTGAGPDGELLQALLLEDEGVRVKSSGRVDMSEFGCPD
jgi:methylated-DNA-protein-cysteine methyltransferase-like protein